MALVIANVTAATVSRFADKSARKLYPAYLPYTAPEKVLQPAPRLAE